MPGVGGKKTGCLLRPSVPVCRTAPDRGPVHDVASFYWKRSGIVFRGVISSAVARPSHRKRTGGGAQLLNSVGAKAIHPYEILKTQAYP